VLYALSYFLVRLVERTLDEEEPEVWPTP
jgi:hypothetical protein